MRRREALCDQMLRLECGLPKFCIEMDCLGKKFEDNQFFSSAHNFGK